MKLKKDKKLYTNYEKDYSLYSLYIIFEKENFKIIAHPWIFSLIIYTNPWRGFPEFRPFVGSNLQALPEFLQLIKKEVKDNEVQKRR